MNNDRKTAKVASPLERLVMWVDIHEQEPELRDDSVLMHFENGSIETVHIEDFFKPIGDGVINGVQLYTKWWMKHEPACTHWMTLPEAPY
jgi:hypothetical protein